jgi:hypothetical protein
MNLEERNQTSESVFNVLFENIPLLFEASNYIEKDDRLRPEQIFIASRDILSHLFDISEDINNQEVVKKNVIEIREHFRRGIMETYQEHYEFHMAHLFNSYGRYSHGLYKFEKLLGLSKKHLELHKKIKEVIKKSQDLWLEGRRNKKNEVKTVEFVRAIQCFKEASELAVSIEGDVQEISSNFYSRAFYVTIGLIGFLSTIIFVSVLLFK